MEKLMTRYKIAFVETAVAETSMAETSAAERSVHRIQYNTNKQHCTYNTSYQTPNCTVNGHSQKIQKYLQEIIIAKSHRLLEEITNICMYGTE